MAPWSWTLLVTNKTATMNKYIYILVLGFGFVLNVQAQDTIITERDTFIQTATNIQVDDVKVIKAFEAKSFADSLVGID